MVRKNLKNVREKHPLVHNITNFVVMNSSANMLLAQGAFPVMAHAINEVEDMVSIANALVINIGTLTDEWVESMVLAGKAANAKGIPVVLDPVGSGATPLRTNACKQILDEVDIAVIRGNASEINSLVNQAGKTRGVDSIHGVDDVADGAKFLALERKAVVAVSGEVDLITDGNRVVRIHNGVPMMSMITGTGCGLSATVAAYIGANEDVFEATASAFSVFCLVGEMAKAKSKGPGSFEVAFMDALYNISEKDIDRADIR
ncbi:MAG: hydroxyethylthiazole kinase [bacterium]